MPAIPAPASDQQIHHPAAAAAAQLAAQAGAAAPQQAVGQTMPAGQPAPSNPPQQEDPFITAVRILMQQGLPEAKARAALQSVPTAGKSLEGWALAAIEWQTAQDDLEAEKRDLELAMQASLREEEERKSQQTPLEQQTPEQLLQHFKGSILLAALRASPLENQLFVAPLLLPVLRLLKLEQQSCRWYASSGTRKFFEALAKECAASAASTAPAAAETPPSTSKRVSKRQKKSPGASRGVAADASAVEGSSPAPEAEGASASADAQTFAEFLNSRAAALEVGVYQMPGTSGEVPAIFISDAADAEADAEEVQEHEGIDLQRDQDAEDAIVLD
ncbi:hypothetical protein COCSUDRAFT_63260 [Coccomyxa subellipsoidea C-169]|uniref:UBA domain-containing protein n=1 Tax=Coccomyxa subellipsoidea (strain C-169) TaxID=574566 RepID=I0YZB6_COCSC|nr:hypothetical protein COCSUDRAFT_63260 [Coccomyxa subellipsoidea C-169]EIE23735.1 hypothetical protein COCSUDRAFT_63260 [Coccomyxa subellipsoidea C-169]|eukprot:XP_005648279.1 hypothetical protein COCSUDRAFT_63260 [Coccomyxa subellipsoidea C-169]